MDDGGFQTFLVLFDFIFDSFFVKVFLRSEVNQIRKLMLINLEQTNRQINWPIGKSIVSYQVN